MIFSRYTTYRPGLFARLLPSGRWKLRLPTATTASVELHTGTRAKLLCLDIAAIGIKKALLWHTVEIRTCSHVETLSCLGEDAATRLATDLHRFINRYLLELIRSDQEVLKEVDAKLEPLIEGKRQYLAQADLAQAIASVSGPAAAALSHPLFDADGLTAAMEADLPRSLFFLTDPDRRHQYNNEFVATELTRYAPFFDDLDGRSLSDQQRESCIRLEDSNLLIASAGSGKSATMVGKVAYVLDKGLYQPEEILVLAYNRAAAEELRERIAQQLGVQPADLQCKVTTFHALGRSIIELLVMAILLKAITDRLFQGGGLHPDPQARHMRHQIHIMFIAGDRLHGCSNGSRALKENSDRLQQRVFRLCEPSPDAFVAFLRKSGLGLRDFKCGAHPLKRTDEHSVTQNKSLIMKHSCLQSP
ncbi:UvrD-helicase domain-containing protein [Rhizobium sp. NLR22b]|uniref:UvrD-helicase domain-containing protein n=1 Tax=Rhizobium sp. NLR22b TaxID=2731115 RepID=UPI00287F6578|nr:UvrD-helicase domain-containing protein [Rhizobium sp. NLR22b]